MNFCVFLQFNLQNANILCSSSTEQLIFSKIWLLFTILNFCLVSISLSGFLSIIIICFRMCPISSFPYFKSKDLFIYQELSKTITLSWILLFFIPPEPHPCFHNVAVITHNFTYFLLRQIKFDSLKFNVQGMW